MNNQDIITTPQKKYYNKNRNKFLEMSKNNYAKLKEDEEFKKKVSEQKKEYYKMKKENKINNKLLQIKEIYNLNDEQYKLLELIRDELFK